MDLDFSEVGWVKDLSRVEFIKDWIYEGFIKVLKVIKSLSRF